MERIFCLILWQEATEGDQTHTNTPHPPSTIVPLRGSVHATDVYNCVVDQTYLIVLPI